jgi:hypothetical protein
VVEGRMNNKSTFAGGGNRSEIGEYLKSRREEYIKSKHEEYMKSQREGVREKNIATGNASANVVDLTGGKHDIVT